MSGRRAGGATGCVRAAIASTVGIVLLTTVPNTVNPPEFCGLSSAVELSLVLMNHSLVALFGVGGLGHRDRAGHVVVDAVGRGLVLDRRVGRDVVHCDSGSVYPPPWMTPRPSVGEVGLAVDDRAVVAAGTRSSGSSRR